MMKPYLLAICLAAILAHPLRAEAAEPRYRYAYSCDGYNQDRDDVAGSAMVIAIFDRAGLATNLVHFHFNSTDPNWMWLLIDADLNPKTGWGGYDFILNRTMDGPTTWLEKNTGGWRWEKLAKIEVVTIGNELMLAVPRQALGLPPSDVVQLDFKWWDQAQKPGDIMDTYLSGDCAPDARFNYRFTTAPISADRPR